MLKSVKWGEFRIGDLFDVDSWVYGKNKKYHMVLEKPSNKTLSVISGITENNGINYYTEDVLTDEEIFEKELTISTRGEYSGTVFYHDEKFVLANNILVMKMPMLSKKQKQFIGSIINSLKYGGYNGYPTKEKLKSDIIQLPIYKDGSVNFDFMEKFISELEYNYLAELEAYLNITGLKDYKLTSKEEKVLEDFENGHINWGRFRIKDVFDVCSYKKRFDANKVIISEKGKPYITRTALNNGLRGFINEDENYLNEGNTISFGQDTATMFYQEKPYFTGDKIKIMKPKDLEINKLNAMFFITVMNKAFELFYWGGSSFSEEIINSQVIDIPVDNDIPNYQMMDTFISAIQKLVIKDVVLYAYKKLNLTKQVIENN